jgi:hypothetical protein
MDPLVGEQVEKQGAGRRKKKRSKKNKNKRKGARQRGGVAGAPVAAGAGGAHPATVSLRLHITQTEASRAHCVPKPQVKQKQLLGLPTKRPKRKGSKLGTKAPAVRQLVPSAAGASQRLGAAARPALPLVPRRAVCMRWNAPVRGGLGVEERVAWDLSPERLCSPPPAVPRTRPVRPSFASSPAYVAAGGREELLCTPPRLVRETEWV